MELKNNKTQTTERKFKAKNDTVFRFEKVDNSHCLSITINRNGNSGKEFRMLGENLQNVNDQQ